MEGKAKLLKAVVCERKRELSKALVSEEKRRIIKSIFCEEKRRIIRRIIKSGCDKIENCETAADLSSPVLEVGQEGRDLRNFQEKM